jgi:hypothetical protein
LIEFIWENLLLLLLISFTTYNVDPVGLGIKCLNIEGVIEREISSDKNYFWSFLGLEIAAELCRL